MTDDPNIHRQQCLRVLDIARQMMASTDLDALLAVVVQQGMALLDAERASLFLYDAERRELFSRIAHGAGEIRFSIDAGIAGACARDRVTIHVPDAYADTRFNRAIDLQTGFATRNLLAVPMVDYEGRLVGVLQVLNRRGGFTGDDIALAEALGAQAGVALQREILMDHLVEKQKLERDLKIARDIQQALFPRRPPELAGWELAGWNRPADQTGGDAYDFFALPGGRIGLLAADATGHGIGPALVVAQTRAMIRALAALAGGPPGWPDVPHLMSTVNALLAEDLDGERFVTCILAVAHEGGQVEYVSAGQGPLLIYHAREDRFDVLPANALPLGVLPDVAFDAPATATLEAGDFVAVTTDGFFEACDRAGRQYGIEAVCDRLRAARHRPAAEMIDALLEGWDAHCAGGRQADDLTAIVLKRL